MSIRVTTAIWDHSKAKLGDRLVLLYIADRCNDDGAGAYPSVAVIAEHCQLSERSVRMSLRRLAQLGELEIETGAGPHGVNRYRVILPGGRICTPPEKSAPARIAPEESAPLKKTAPTPEESAPPPLKNTTSGGADFSPNTSVNTSTEPSTEPSEKRARANPAKPERAAKRAARLPDDWEPSQRQRESLADDGYSALEIAAEAAKFRNYHAHKGDAGLDWGRAFANWMARSREFAPSRAAPNAPGYRPKYNAQGQRVWTMADLREEEKHEQQRNSEALVEAPSRVVSR